MPRISYVVTVYNKRPYLPFLLAGLVAQRGDFDREFIFVDDGSNDGSADVLRDLNRGRSNVSIIEQANQGPARALNRGLLEARGDLIKPMDADDVLLPDATAVLLEAMTSTGQRLAFGDQAHYRTDVAGGPEAVIAQGPSPHGRIVDIPDALQRTLRRAQTTPSAWLADAAVVRLARGCDPDVFVQDYSIELRMARYTGFAKVEAPVFLAPESAPGRLSEQEAQTLHDINLAVCHFLRDLEHVTEESRRYALARVLGRAWTWGRRHESGIALLSAEFRHYARTRLRLFPTGDALIDAACTTFRRTHPIRLPATEATGAPF
ncbi:MAG: glycosyltransferase family A protein [Rhodospirillaceae bacterium]